MKYRQRTFYTAKQKSEMWDPSAMQASPTGQWMATRGVVEFDWTYV
jgi:hypothetical protein